MKNWKRMVALGMVTTMAAATMAGCGGSSSSSSDSSSSEGDTSSAAGEITLTIWDTNQQKGIQEICDDWTATSGTKVNVQVVDWDNYWTLLEAGASGGELPDVFWMHSNQAQKYMENDMLLDLTDKIKESETIDLNNYYEDITALYTSDGKNYAIPKDIDTIALWYNKTMFDEAGIAYPDDTWTWDDMAEAAKKLTKDDGSQYGYGINTSNNQDSFYNMIYSHDGYVISDDKKTSGFDDPKTIEAMQYVVDMVQAGYCPDLNTISENGADVLFESGKVAMVTQGSWMVSAFKDNEYTSTNCDVAVLPKDAATGKRVSIYNGLGYAASANGKNTEASWKLIEYLGSKEAQTKQAELGVTMSAYKGTSDAWVKSTDAFNLQGHLDMLDAELVFRPYSKNTTVWEDNITESLKAAWTGEKSCEDVCKEIAAFMNQTLAEE